MTCTLFKLFKDDHFFFFFGGGGGGGGGGGVEILIVFDTIQCVDGF